MAAQVATNTNMMNNANNNPSQQFASLYVGDLHADVTETMLYEMFNNVGPVASIRVCRDSATRRSLGYAYVNYHSVNDAERALDALNYQSIKGRCCRIMWSHRDPALRKTGQGNVFVKNLDRNIDNKALYDTFSLFGNILSCKVAQDKEGKSLGYGFVHYETEEAASQAIERVNNMMIGDKTVFVGPFQRRENRDQTDKKFTNIYVKNFPVDWDDEQLKASFETFGVITSVALQTDKKGRKFGFVNFENFDDARAAVDEMHNKDLREDKSEELLEEDRFYCQRAMSKLEREIALKRQFAKDDTQQLAVNLYIKNLDDGIDDERLQQLFESFGEITSAKVMSDDAGVSRGFGFVSFDSPDAATKAVTEMHLKLVAGKPLYVGLAEKRDVRQARLQERFRTGGAAAGGPRGPMGGMGGVGGAYNNNMYMRPQMPMMPMMQGWRGGPMRPQMMMPNMMYGMRGMMPGMQGARGVGAPGGDPRNMYKFTPQARNQQMPGGGVNAMAGGAGGGHPTGMDGRGGESMQAFNPSNPLTAASLAAAPPGMQKQMLGEKLFPLVARQQPELAGKITGMMLEMDNSELLILLESDTQLKAKVDEALRVIEGKQ